jgi:hypothetical protein
MDLPGQVLAYFVTDHTEVETVIVAAEPDGSPPRERRLSAGPGVAASGRLYRRLYRASSELSSGRFAVRLEGSPPLECSLR